MNEEAMGKMLRDLRGDRRPEEVAVAAGVSVSAISLYENGKRTPRPKVMRKLADYYGVPVADIFFPDDGHPERTEDT